VRHLSWAHGNYFGLELKYPRIKDEGLSVFIDPEGYKKYVEEREETFKKELAKQRVAVASETMSVCFNLS
jgi:metallo-beta-lactamase class B